MAMEQESKKGQNAALVWLGDAMASHPSSDKRVSQAEEMKGLIKTQGGMKVTPEFLQMKKVAQELVEKHKTAKK